MNIEFDDDEINELSGFFLQKAREYLAGNDDAFGFPKPKPDLSGVKKFNSPWGSLWKDTKKAHILAFWKKV